MFSLVFTFRLFWVTCYFRWWEYMSVGYICILKRFFPFSLFIPVDINFQFDSLCALPFEGRCREWGEDEVLLTTDTVPACYHSYTATYSHITLYLRWTPPHPSGLTLSTVYSNIISGINLSPEMLTLSAVLCMNLIKFMFVWYLNQFKTTNWIWIDSAVFHAWLSWK